MKTIEKDWRNDIFDVFKQLNNEFEIKNVFSYQETGILSTWKRDIQISKFLNSNRINWKEFQTNYTQQLYKKDILNYIEEVWGKLNET